MNLVQPTQLHMALGAPIASRPSSARSENHGEAGRGVARGRRELHPDNRPGVVEPPLSPSPGRRYVWDADGRCFNAGPLREAMLVRGFTADELAAAAALARGTVYNALSGRPTRPRTARRILEVLAGVEPTLRLGSLTEDP